MIWKQTYPQSRDQGRTGPWIKPELFTLPQGLNMKYGPISALTQVQCHSALRAGQGFSRIEDKQGPQEEAFWGDFPAWSRGVGSDILTLDLSIFFDITTLWSDKPKQNNRIAWLAWKTQQAHTNRPLVPLVTGSRWQQVMPGNLRSLFLHNAKSAEIKSLTFSLFCDPVIYVIPAFLSVFSEG